MNKKLEKILVLALDFITINLAGVFFFYLRVESGWFELITTPEFLLPLLIIYLYWVLIFTFIGMYRTWFASSRFDELSTLFKASFVGIFVLFFLIFIDDYMHGVASSGRILILLYWAFFLVFVGTGRLLVRSIQRKLLINGVGRRNAFLVGFNKRAFEVQDQLTVSRALGLDLVGYIAVDEHKIGKEYKGCKVVGDYTEITRLVEQYSVKEIIISLEKENHDILVDLISKFESRNVSLKIVPDLYEILSGQARTSQIYGLPLIDIMPELMPEWEKKLKRLFDIVISFLILLISSPFLLITALAIKLNSPGPVFFIQERSGRYGKPFRMIKFRSMFQDAEKKTGPVWSHKGDPRVTSVGRILRKLRIDEIPQMMNVLKGEMSIVGPRPERPYFVEKLSLEIPYYKRRLKVRPGVTGWAQVKHKYDESIEDVKIKLRYDLFYIENISLRMDFKILARTVFVVLFGKGHYH